MMVAAYIYLHMHSVELVIEMGKRTLPMSHINRSEAKQHQYYA
jgi:hypothetical protein